MLLRGRTCTLRKGVAAELPSASEVVTQKRRERMRATVLTKKAANWVFEPAASMLLVERLRSQLERLLAHECLIC